MIVVESEVIKFRSELERVCWETWLPTFPHIAAYYEPIVLKTAGGRYTPDFLIVTPEHRLVYVEVKGSWKQRGAARSKRIMREAAGTFSWMAEFIAVLPEKQRKKNKKLVVDKWKVEHY